MQASLASNSQIPACLCLLGTGIKGVRTTPCCQIIDFLEPVAYSTGDGGWECNHGDMVMTLLLWAPW